MDEMFIQFIWQHRLLPLKMQLTTGEEVNIVKVGKLNHNEGPDFSEAEIQINDVRLYGSIEIHLKRSDWFAHKHEQNLSYSNTILHVVWDNDTNMPDLPTLQLSSYVPQSTINKYYHFRFNKTIPCHGAISEIPSIIIKNFYERLLIDRLEEKAQQFRKLLIKHLGDVEKAALVWIGKHFGFNLNNSSFEILFNQIDIQILRKLSGDELKLEAYIFGKSGLLPSGASGYPFALAESYRYIKQKFDLNETEPIIWKLMRTRPANFPTIRIAQYAAILNFNPSIWQSLLEARTYYDYVKLFSKEPNHYWNTHYHFGKETPSKTSSLGKSSIDLLIINAVVPAIIGYGKWQSNEKLIEKGMQIINSISPEKNKLISTLESAGLKFTNAADSQAGIHLFKNYCEERRCLNCHIGQYLIKRT